MDAVLTPASATGPVFIREITGGVLLLRPHSRLGNLQESDIIKEAGELLGLINHSGAMTVLIDLENDDYIGTALVGAIVRLWKRIALQGGRLALCNISDTVYQVFRVTRLHAVWPMYPTRDDAFKALNA